MTEEGEDCYFGEELVEDVGVEGRRRCRVQHLHGDGSVAVRRRPNFTETAASYTTAHDKLGERKLERGRFYIRFYPMPRRGGGRGEGGRPGWGEGGGDGGRREGRRRREGGWWGRGGELEVRRRELVVVLLLLVVGFGSILLLLHQRSPPPPRAPRVMTLAGRSLPYRRLYRNRHRLHIPSLPFITTVTRPRSTATVNVPTPTDGTVTAALLPKEWRSMKRSVERTLSPHIRLSVPRFNIESDRSISLLAMR